MVLYIHTPVQTVEASISDKPTMNNFRGSQLDTFQSESCCRRFLLFQIPKGGSAGELSKPNLPVLPVVTSPQQTKVKRQVSGEDIGNCLKGLMTV